MRAALLVLAGCGRLGFADQPAAPDAAQATPFDVEGGHCLAGQTGPFVEVASFATTGGGYGVWAAPPYVLMADTNGGLHSLRFDGASFVEIDHLDFGWVEDVWQVAGTTFVASPGTGLAALSIADGKITVLVEDTAHTEARRGWSSDGVLYLPEGGAGLFALRWTGSAFEQLAPALPTMSWAQGAWTSGTRTVFADANALRVVDFDGSALADGAPPLTAHGGTSRVWSKDGHTVFVASADGVTAYALGAALTELATFATDGTARDVWSDGAHVFAASEHGGVYALAFDGAQFTRLAQTDIGHTGLGVIGDGDFVFANDLESGLHAYSGFACTQRE